MSTGLVVEQCSLAAATFLAQFRRTSPGRGTFLFGETLLGMLRIASSESGRDEQTRNQ